jgi:hypothetical protein
MVFVLCFITIGIIAAGEAAKTYLVEVIAVYVDAVVLAGINLLVALMFSGCLQRRVAVQVNRRFLAAGIMLRTIAVLALVFKRILFGRALFIFCS